LIKKNFKLDQKEKIYINNLFYSKLINGLSILPFLKS